MAVAALPLVAPIIEGEYQKERRALCAIELSAQGIVESQIIRISKTLLYGFR